MQIGDFSNLYGASISVILVSSALQEVLKARVALTREKLARLYEIKATVSLAEAANDYVDRHLPDTEHLFEQQEVKLKKDLFGFSVFSWSGVSVPLVCMFYGAFTDYDVGLGLIVFTLAICYGWGVVAYVFTRSTISSRLADIDAALINCRAVLLTGRVTRVDG
jgi:hypothetical protein